MYSRFLREKIERKLGSGKAIVVIGPRQVGKTTLIESILETKDYLLLNGDDPKTRSLLTEPNTEQIRTILGKYKLVFIDEAQRIEGIGLTMKIIIDRSLCGSTAESSNYIYWIMRSSRRITVDDGGPCSVMAAFNERTRWSASLHTIHFRFKKSKAEAMMPGIFLKRIVMFVST